MITITRKIEFDAGHRVLGHESKCANLHGHRYVAEITVSALALDSISRVVDFSVIKLLVGGWIDEHWDHNMILNRDDPLLNAYVPCEDETWETMEREEGCRVLPITRDPVCGPKRPYLMPKGQNPTAETMAEVLYHVAADLLNMHELTVNNVRLYETPNCWADYKQ